MKLFCVLLIVVLSVVTGCRSSGVLQMSPDTYDQINNPDVARVARESGNSVGVVETEYFALNGVTKETAQEWFALFPPETTRVIVPMTVQK